jgi:hypothetical protein
MGIVNKVLVGNALQYENNKGGGKRDLRFIRNTPGCENDDDRDEVKKVIIYQRL